MGDHTEALEVDFAPEEISFEQIAKSFWREHNPCATRNSRQYMSAIWYHNDKQHDVLEAMRSKIEEAQGARIVTPILPHQTFFLAEDYHQKFRLQRYPTLMGQFKTFYPVFKAFNDSTAAARVNGLIGGNGSRKMFEEESAGYGLDIEDLSRTLRF